MNALVLEYPNSQFVWFFLNYTPNIQLVEYPIVWIYVYLFTYIDTGVSQSQEIVGPHWYTLKLIFEYQVASSVSSLIAFQKHSIRWVKSNLNLIGIRLISSILSPDYKIFAHKVLEWCNFEE